MDEEKILLKAQQIASQEGSRGRNEAFAVFALLALLISIGGFLSVGFVVNRAIENAGLESYVTEAKMHIENISGLAETAEEELATFQAAGGYQQLLDQLDDLGGQVSIISERMSSPISSCRSVTGSFDDGGTGDTCSNHSNWMGAASCGSGEAMTQLQVVAREVSGTYRCAFRARCCALLQ